MRPTIPSHLLLTIAPKHLDLGGLPSPHVHLLALDAADDETVLMCRAIARACNAAGMQVYTTRCPSIVEPFDNAPQTLEGSTN